MDPHSLGPRSEQLACDYLSSHGWRILARNYRAGHKEIDIIAARGHTIAFVEVKGRAGDSYGHPLDAITWRKRREVTSAARIWLAEHPKLGTETRFDAIAVSWRGRTHALEHFENAWSTR